MKMTIQEVIDKLNDIGRAIDAIDEKIETDSFGQEPLNEAIDLLNEYANIIRNTKVEI